MLLDPDYTGKEEKSHLEQLLKELKGKYDLTGKRSRISCRVSLIFHLVMNHHLLSLRCFVCICGYFSSLRPATASALIKINFKEASFSLGLPLSSLIDCLYIFFL